MEQIPEGIKWVVGTLISLALALCGILGIGKLRELKQLRQYSREDKRSDTETANKSAQINADASIAQAAMDRLNAVEDRLNAKIDGLETKLETVREELSTQREMNAKKDVEVSHLKEENQRLRDRCREQDKEIAALRAELDTLKLLVAKNGPSLLSTVDTQNVLDVRLVDPENKDS
jgi:chromosome segregation ATPase